MTGKSPPSRCEQERLHLSGAIQSFGVLLGVEREPPHHVLHVSANAEALLGRSPEALLGVPLAALELVEIDELKKLGRVGQRLRLSVRRTYEQLDWATLVDNGYELILELEPRRAPAADHEGLLRTLHGPPPRPEEELTRLAEHVRGLLGYERVLVYRFHPDWSGEVVAESAEPEAGGFLGLRFPAGDIPANARALYASNPYRLIADIEAEAVPVLGIGGIGAPDLTWSALRSVSPFHLEYLRNMGVRSSLSLPILPTGTLWGLVTCHDRALRVPDMAARTAAVERVNLSALQLTRAQIEMRIRRIDRNQHWAAGIDRLLREARDWLEGLALTAVELQAHMEAAGFVAMLDGQWIRLGEVPSEPVLDRIEALMEVHARGGLLLTDCLSELMPGEPEALRMAGLLGMRVGLKNGRELLLMWFRPSEVTEVVWAGREALEPDTTTLGPRRSFEAWVEQRKRHARPWDDGCRLAAKTLRGHLVRASVAREGRPMAANYFGLA